MNDKANELPVESGGEEVYYSLEITSSLTRLGPTVVRRCVEIGVVQPNRPANTAEPYSPADVVRLRRVRRLIEELGLNWAGVEVVMRLTDELEQLRQEMARLRSGL